MLTPSTHIRSHALQPAPFVWYAVAVLWLGYVASASSAPYDWDPSYYLGVAQNIRAGRGAISGGLWNLSFLPDALPYPADLHWMPLPSRWLVPFLYLPLSPWRASQLATVLVGACWAPLAWAWARRFGALPAEAHAAAAMGASAGAYAHYLSIPDSFALYGTLGSAAMLAGAAGRVALTSVLLVAAALARTDGFLLGLFMLPFLGRHWVVGLSGVGASGLWSIRNWSLAGDGYLALRERSVMAVEPEAWMGIVAPPGLSMVDRASFVLEHAVDIARTWGLGVFYIGLPLVVLGAWRARSDGVWMPLVYGLVSVPVLYFLAPAVAFEGSGFRSSAAVFPTLAALGALGAGALTRRYHPGFLPGMYAGVLAAVSAVVATSSTLFPGPFEDCAALDSAGVPVGAAVLSYDPLGVDTRCAHVGVILSARADATEVERLSTQFQADYVLTAPDGYGSWTMESSEFSIPGWKRLGDRVWARR